MAKLTARIAISIILTGIFILIISIALGFERLEPAFYLVILLLVLYVFLFGLAVGQRFSSPVKKLLDRAAELNKGNLSSRVYLETKDELSELAEAFNKIAEQLQASQQRQEETEKSVAIKVKARTQELEETINALEQKVRNRTVELEKLIAESNGLQEELKKLKKA